MSEKLKRFFFSNAGLWLIFIVWTLFVSNFWLPRNWGFYGTDDWDLTYTTYEVARKSIIEFGQWPSYNPYCAFGSDLDANPQATHASIFFIPILLFGTFYGYKLSVLLAMLMGCWGAYKLFKSMQPDPLISLSTTLVFVGCSFFSRHVFQAGHSNMLYFYLLPWLAYFLNRLRLNGTPADIFWPVFILTQSLTGGAPFIFIVFVLFMGLWSIGILWIEKGNYRTALLFAWIVLLSIGLSAWKIWPTIDYWEYLPRLVRDHSGINLLIWLQALSDYETDTRTAHLWHEFSMGFSFVLLAITLYFFKNIPNGRKWLILFLVVFWLSLGNMPPYVNPWYVLNHYVPVFTSLRAPYRFGLLIVFLLCVAFIRSAKFGKDNRLIYFILVAIVFSTALKYNSITKKIIGSPRLEDLRDFPSRSKHDPLPVSLSAKERLLQYIFIKNNHLINNAYEPLSLMYVGDTLTTFVSNAKLLDFSPNRFTIRTKDSGDVLIALRFNKNWQLHGQGKLVNRNGLMGIEHGKGDIELAYYNPVFRKGLIISGIFSVILIVSLLVFARKRKLSQA